MIYVTVGTMYLDFPRLIRAADKIAEETGEKTVVQTGMGNTMPLHCEHFGFKPRDEVAAIQREARVIVTHAGIGSVIDALKAARPLLVVPRLKRFGEHNNDHQLDLARAVERRGWGRTILDIAELGRACGDPPPAHTAYTPAKDALIHAVRDTIKAALRS